MEGDSQGAVGRGGGGGREQACRGGFHDGTSVVEKCRRHVARASKASEDGSSGGHRPLGSLAARSRYGQGPWGGRPASSGSIFERASVPRGRCVLEFASING